MSNIQIDMDRVGAIMSEKIMDDVAPLFLAATLLYDEKITFADEMEMLNSIKERKGNIYDVRKMATNY